MEPTSYFVKRHALVNRILNASPSSESYEDLYNRVKSDWVTEKLFDDALEVLIDYKQIMVQHYDTTGWKIHKIQDLD